MKTREEVEKLKQMWSVDGCWDIEETEGFEGYYKELLQFRLEAEKEYEDRNKQEHLRLESLQCPMMLSNPYFNGRNCYVEKCAWWNNVYKCCCIKIMGGQK